MPHARNLKHAPRYHRAAQARGLASTDLIEPTGGRQNAGLIRDVAVITRGEALGHDEWIDRDFIFAVKQAINAAPAGIKSRFTHPSLSSDGLGSYLGRLTNATVRDNVVHADLHLAASAHNTPDGDLAEYVMHLAAEDPAAFGLSIVFAPDLLAEEEHTARHTDETGEYRSPDADNGRNLPHSRLAQLRAADAVDDPAANPNGLFHRADELAIQADQLAAYALGLPGATAPPATSLDVHPQRLADYLARFLERHNLEIRDRRIMTTAAPPAAEPAPVAAADPPAATPLPADPPATPETQPDQAEPDEATPAAAPAEGAPPPAPPAAGTADPLAAGRLAVAEYLRKFGPQGAEWFAAGKTEAECYDLALAALRDRNTQLEQALTAFRGQSRPVEFQHEPTRTERPGSANPCRIRAANN
jgi:hypothetical protein